MLDANTWEGLRIAAALVLIPGLLLVLISISSRPR